MATNVESAPQFRDIRVKAEIVEDFDTRFSGANDTSTLPQSLVQSIHVSNEQVANTDAPKISVKEEGSESSLLRWESVKLSLNILWDNIPAIPSVPSRRVWAMARGIEPRLVHNWFYGRKYRREKKGFPPHPQEGYHLDVQDPPGSLGAPPPPATALEPALQTPPPVAGPSSSSPPPQTPLNLDSVPDVEIVSSSPLFDRSSPGLQFLEASNSIFPPSFAPVPKKGPIRVRLTVKEETVDPGLLHAPTIKAKAARKRKAVDDVEIIQGGGSTAAGSEPAVSSSVAKKAAQPSTKKRRKTSKSKKVKKEPTGGKNPAQTTKPRTRSPKPRKVKKEAVDLDALPPAPEISEVIILSPTPIRNCTPPHLSLPQNDAKTFDMSNPTSLNIPPHSFASSTYTSLLVAPFAMDATAMHRFSLVDGCVLCQASTYNGFTDSDFIEPFDEFYFTPPQEPVIPQFDFSRYELADPTMFATDFESTLQSSFGVNSDLGLWDPLVEAMPVDYLTGQFFDPNVGWP